MVNKEVIQIKTRELYHLLLIKDVDVLFAHQLFKQIYDVAWCRYLVRTANSPEAESLARCSLESARNELDDTLRKLELCDLDRKLVRYIADNVGYGKI